VNIQEYVTNFPTCIWYSWNFLPTSVVCPMLPTSSWVGYYWTTFGSL